MIETISAFVFIVLSGVAMIFQGCLAAGVPWGEASMGGRYPGKYPTKMRIVAVINIILLGFFITIILSEADLMFPLFKPISSIGIWFVVVFFIIGTILNTITPSKIERIWAPVALLQLITSIIVLIN